MKGKEIFEKEISENSQYARTLLTAYNIEGENLFSLLEKAEKQGKKIILRDVDQEGPSEPIVAIG